MAKKKKNLRKKKSNNLLKGAVTAGAVVGGGAIFQGNNVVYAAEMNSNSISDSGSTDIGTESMSASTTQSESVSIPTSTEESDTNFPAGIHRAVYLIDNKLMLLMKLVIRMRKIKREIKIRQMKMNQFPYRLPNHFQRLRLMHYLKVKTS